MMTRNRLAAYKARGPWALPPPLKEEHSCRSCMVLPLCAVAHQAMEEGNPESFGLVEQFAKLTEHLTDQDSQFFRRWIHLLEMEQEHDRVPQANIWAVDPPPHVSVRSLKRPRGPSMRGGDVVDNENVSPNSEPTSQVSQDVLSQYMEEDHAAQMGFTQDDEPAHPLVGRCIGSLLPLRFDGQNSDMALYPFAYTFSQPNPFSQLSHASIPLNAQGFAVGDCGILSVQDRHAAVTRVRVLAVSASELKLALRSRLPSSLDVACSDGVHCQRESCFSHHGLRWRLDKDEPETAFQCAVSGLLELIVSQTAHTERLRGLIVRHNKPQHDARDNYSQEVPIEMDCFESMVESECVPEVMHRQC